MPGEKVTKMSHIVVVGSLNMDLVVRVPKLPLPGETVLGGEFGTYPGGKGANQAVAAARLGARVSMIGRVGDDDFGQSLVENLKTEGIDVRHVSRDKHEATGIAMITVDENGQNSIAVASGANMQLQPDDVQNAWEELEDPDILVMPLEVPVPCLQRAAELAREANTKVVLNPAPARTLSDEFLQLVDVIVPNETETKILTGSGLTDSDDASSAGCVLQTRGIPQVVLTLGDRGALAFDGDADPIKISAHVVEVVDTTAAGDAFVGGLSVALAEGKSLPDSARFANAAGALATMVKGAQPAMPSRKAVLELLGNE
jgi:ribokinase